MGTIQAGSKGTYLGRLRMRARHIPASGRNGRGTFPEWAARVPGAGSQAARPGEGGPGATAGADGCYRPGCGDQGEVDGDRPGLVIGGELARC